MYCGQCGKKTEERAKFCAYCGAPVILGTAQQNPAQNINYAQSKMESEEQSKNQSSPNGFDYHKTPDYMNETNAPPMFAGYLVTGGGILLKGILSALMTITGNTATSDSVSLFINYLVIGCCVFGVILTIDYQKKSGEKLISLLIPHAIIVTLGLLLAKALVFLIIIAVVLVIFDIATGATFIRMLFDQTYIPDDNMPQQEQQMSSIDIKAQEDEARRRQVINEFERAGYDRSDIHVNSDGSKYYIGDGDWNSVSSNAERYQDSSGNWHSFNE